LDSRNTVTLIKSALKGGLMKGVNYALSVNHWPAIERRDVCGSLKHLETMLRCGHGNNCQCAFYRAQLNIARQIEGRGLIAHLCTPANGKPVVLIESARTL